MDWQGVEREFRLGIGELRELQEKCDAGPMAILARLHGRDWRIDDIRETIRLGLIGAGVKKNEALAIVRKEVDNGFLLDHVEPARIILGAALTGPPDEIIKREPAESQEGKESAPKTGGLSSVPSTPPALQ